MLKATEVENSQVAPGKVTGQADAADSLVEQGKTITVTVAKAPAAAAPADAHADAHADADQERVQRGRGPGRPVPLTRSEKPRCRLPPRRASALPGQCLMSGLRSAARSAAPAMPSDSSQLPSIW